MAEWKKGHAGHAAFAALAASLFVIGCHAADNVPDKGKAAKTVAPKPVPLPDVTEQDQNLVDGQIVWENHS